MGAKTKEVETGISALSKVPGSIQEAAANKAAQGATPSSGTPTMAKATVEEIKGRNTLSNLRDDAKNAPTLSKEKKAGWNRFTVWMDDKGYAGQDYLDTGGKGNALFDQFLKENQSYFKAHPERAISRADLPSVRKALAEFRERKVDDMVRGYDSDNPNAHTSFYDSDAKIMHSGKKGDYTNYLSWVNENEKRQDPNYVGKNLSSFKFTDTPPSKRANLSNEAGKQAVYQGKKGKASDWWDEDGNYVGAKADAKTINEGTITTKPSAKSNEKRSSGGSLTVSNYQ